MLQLVSENVPLKPAHKRRILGWLKSSLKMGQRVGDFVMKMTIQRRGNHYIVEANVTDQAGTFLCRSRQHDLLDACRDTIQKLHLQLHNQRLSRLAA